MNALPHIVLAVALALPAAATAEGARRVFTCEGEDGAVASFTITPVETDAGGKGSIAVAYDGKTYAGVTGSDHGPFQFGTATEHFALLIEGTAEDGRLTVHLHHATESQSTLTPFICETDI